MLVRHLYVHVPFCPTICPFCSFHVLERRQGVVAAYLAELDRDAAQLADRFDVALDTVYLGGGTPSHLRTDEVAQVFAIVHRHFAVEEDAEITLEAHPVDVHAAAVNTWRELGVTRLSVGVQSTDDTVLARLGRSHDSARGLAALDIALSAGFPVVNADIITAVEGQDVAADLRRIAARGVNHLSAYTLTIESGTPFERDRVAVDAEAEATAFDLAGEILGDAGLPRYEASNHARPGAQCRHNLAYWHNRPYLGLGPGATGHEPTDAGTQRRTNPPLNRWLTGDRGEAEVIGPETFVAETLLAGLRLVAGIDLTGLPVSDATAAAIERLVTRGWCERAGTRLRPTAEGLRLHNRVAAELV